MIFHEEYSINWPNFCCLIGVTSWDIEEHVHCNCLFLKLKSQDKNLNILRTKRNFKVKRKAFFIIFKEISVFKKCLRPNSPPLNFLHGKVYLLNIFLNIFWTKDVTDFTEAVLESSCKVLQKKVKIKTHFDSFYF